jgi:hypothetical protein
LSLLSGCLVVIVVGLSGCHGFRCLPNSKTNPEGVTCA